MMKRKRRPVSITLHADDPGGTVGTCRSLSPETLWTAATKSVSLETEPSDILKDDCILFKVPIWFE